MANTKISALGSGALPQAADEFVVARAGANFKLTFTQLLSNIAVDVGIGAASVGAKLDVAGSIRATGNTVPASGAGVELAYTGGIGYVTAYDRTGVSFMPLSLRGSTVQLMIGNVGINAAPVAKLHVLTSGTDLTDYDLASGADVLFSGPDRVITNGSGTLVVVANGTATADFGGSIAFGATYTGTVGANFAKIKAGKVGSYGGYLAFATRPDGGSMTERVRINEAGNMLFAGTPTIYNLTGNLYVRAGTGGMLHLGANAANSLVMIDTFGNFGVGTSTFGTSAQKVMSVANGSGPSTGPADTVQFYSSDDAAGHTIPSFYCEGTNVVATGQPDPASSVRVKMRINGTVRTFLCI